MRPSSPATPDPMPAAEQLFDRLRRRIRRLILWEGTACAGLVLATLFWIGLALDYLPVRIGFHEQSTLVRGVGLAVALTALAVVVYRSLGRRWWVPFSNTDLALLVERRYPQFQDSLITSVQDQADANPDGDRLLARTRLTANQLVAQVRPEEVVQGGHVKRSAMIAMGALSSVLALAIWQPALTSLAGQRLYLLSPKHYPRASHIELVGLNIQRVNPVDGIDLVGNTQPAVNGQFRVAQGSTFSIVVHAAEHLLGKEMILPESCRMYYRQPGGASETIPFKRIGAPRDGLQTFLLDGPPLERVLTSFDFEVVGGDHRIGPFRVEVVDAPFVKSTQLHCRYPDYLRDTESLRFTDRDLAWQGKSSLPIGTQVTLVSQTNKPLQMVYYRDRAGSDLVQQPPAGDTVSVDVTISEQPYHGEFFLLDTDGILSDQPFVIDIEPVKDQAPVVETRLTGIGTAVTPDARIPVTGSVLDDYGIDQVALDWELGESAPQTVDVRWNRDGSYQAEIDLRAMRQSGVDLPISTDAAPLQLAIQIRAIDRCSLAGQPNTGIGDRYELEVVSADRLLQLLEQLEVGQRRRLEQILKELQEVKTYLMRTGSSGSRERLQIVEPGDRNQPQTDDVTASEEPLADREIRSLFAQRAAQQIDKSAAEILGCASAFDNIRLQLIHNRIQNISRQQRFETEIIPPLQSLATVRLKELASEAESLQAYLTTGPADGADWSPEVADSKTESCITKSELALVELEQLLERLMRYETQNELLDIVRQMIQRQQSLLDRTIKERQKRAFESLID